MPQRAINRLAGRLAELQRPRWLKRWIVAGWVRAFPPDPPPPADANYESLQALFLRELPPGARPIGPGLVSPVDGLVVSSGRLKGQSGGTQRLGSERAGLDVKGESLDLAALLALDADAPELDAYQAGWHFNIFLEPTGYHWVHAPWDARLVGIRWIPGRYFPQNRLARQRIRSVFSRNERSVLSLELEPGRPPLLLVMVAASLVGGIRIAGLSGSDWMQDDAVELDLPRAKGQKLGAFALGSTVILLAPAGSGLEAPALAAGRRLRMGEAISGLSSADGEARIATSESDGEPLPALESHLALPAAGTRDPASERAEPLSADPQPGIAQAFARAGGILAAGLAARIAALLGPSGMALWPAHFVGIPGDYLVAGAWLLMDLLRLRWLKHRLARVAAGLLYALTLTWLVATSTITRVLGSPPTLPMLSGAGLELQDSVITYVTSSNLTALSFVAVFSALGYMLAGDRARAARRPSYGRGRLIGLTAAALGLLVWHQLGMRHAPSPPVPNAILAICAGLPQRLAPLRLRSGLVSIPTRGRVDGSPTSTEGQPAQSLPPLPDLDELWPSPEQLLLELRGVARGRHVIWVVLESAAAGYLKPWARGAPPAMPRLYELSQQGLVFQQAYAPYPESVKALYGALCGRPTAAFVPAESHAAGRMPCDPLPGQLGQAGYRTGLFHSGSFAYFGMREILEDRGFDTLVDASLLDSPFRTSFGVDEETTTRAMLSWIDSDPSAPIFLMYLPIAGHHPYESPGGKNQRRMANSDYDRYLGDLGVADAALGGLVDGLIERGLWENSLLVVSGDHGEAFNQHPGNVAHSMALYEENIRVPLLLVAPGLEAVQGENFELRQTDGIAAGILEMLGMGVPASFSQPSLLAAGQETVYAYTDHGRWLVALRHGPWKAIHDVAARRTWHYDLRSDPGETEDLSRVQRARAEGYAGHLRALAGVKP
jgi:phosphatidylserine decarboxylase precursor